MQRIAIIGLAGSGKSRFANKLGKALNRSVIHLDKEWWTSDWKKKYASMEDFKDFQRQIVKQNTWIIDGNYSSSLDIRLDRADTIIFFDFPKWRCLWRAFVRVFNRQQPFDKPEGAKEKFRWELVKFIVTYPTHELRQKVDGYKNKASVFTVRNNREIEQLFKKLTQHKSIFQKVKDLNLPLGQYVIIGGGILEALGIRNTNDVDIMVTPELFEKLRKSGKYQEEMRWGKPFLFAKGIDIGKKLEWENYHCTVEEGIKTATIINGIPFLNLEETIKFKKAMGREKDFKDIELIEEYLKNQIISRLN